MYDFEKINDLCREEKRLVERIARLKYISSPSLTYWGEKGGFRKSKAEKVSIERAVLSEELNEVQIQINELREPLINDTKQMEPGLNRLIAKLHFGYGISIRKIAQALDYAEDYVFRCRNETIEILKKLEDKRKAEQINRRYISKKSL